MCKFNKGDVIKKKQKQNKTKQKQKTKNKTKQNKKTNKKKFYGLNWELSKISQNLLIWQDYYHYYWN